MPRQDLIVIEERRIVREGRRLAGRKRKYRLYMECKELLRKMFKKIEFALYIWKAKRMNIDTRQLIQKMCKLIEKKQKKKEKDLGLGQ